MPLRVCHVITGLRRGGAENSLLRLIEQLEPGRFTHRVIALVGGEVSADLRRAGADVVVIGLGPRKPHRLYRVLTAVKGWNPHLVNGWMYHGNLAALLARGRTDRVPLIWSIRHSPESLTHLSFHARAAVRFGAVFSSLPELLIFNSFSGSRKHMARGYTPQSVEVIPNGFDVTRFYPEPADRSAMRARLKIPESAVGIGMIARHHPIKNHRLFLKAAERICAQSDDLHFVLVGAGVDSTHPMFRAGAERIGRQRVHLLGRRDDVPRLLRALDILALTSHAEGMPNVIGEAMASGVPCVSTDVGDVRELVGDTGFVVPSGDEVALSAAWTRLIEGGPAYRRSMGLKARRRIIQRYTLRETIARYQEHYEKLGRMEGTRK